MEKDVQATLNLYEAVSVLHRRGYERIRLSSYLSASGFYLRTVISVKENFDKVTGFYCYEDKRYPIYRYTSGMLFNYFENFDSLERITPSDLADLILRNNRELERFGRGDDPLYVRWFNSVLDHARNEEFPYAFDDSEYDIYSEKHIRILGKRDYIEYAPPGEFEFPKEDRER